MDDVTGALLPLVEDDAVRWHVLRECLEYLAREFSLDRVPSVYITGVHRILKKVTGITLPYGDLRRQCNEIGLVLAERIAARSAGMSERARFETLVRWAIAGNELDFRTVGTGYEIDVDQIECRLQKCVDDPLAVDQLDRIYQLVQQASRILYIPDNVGEIAFDLLLVRQFKAWGKTVLFPLRGGPITSDATLADGELVGAADAADEVFSAGPDTLGILFAEASPRLIAELGRADLIVCKGQANFYTFSENSDYYTCPVVSLLRTKCDWATAYFGLTGKRNIAAILQ